MATMDARDVTLTAKLSTYETLLELAFVMIARLGPDEPLATLDALEGSARRIMQKAPVNAVAGDADDLAAVQAVADETIARLFTRARERHLMR